MEAAESPSGRGKKGKGKRKRQTDRGGEREKERNLRRKGIEGKEKRSEEMGFDSHSLSPLSLSLLSPSSLSFSSLRQDLFIPGFLRRTRAQGSIVSLCLAETRRERSLGSIDRLSEEAVVTITRSSLSFSFSFLSLMARQVS